MVLFAVDTVKFCRVFLLLSLVELIFVSEEDCVVIVNKIIIASVYLLIGGIFEFPSNQLDDIIFRCRHVSFDCRPWYSV